MITISSCSEYEEVIAQRPTSCLDKKISDEAIIAAKDFVPTIKTTFKHHQSCIKQLNLIQEFYEQYPQEFKIELADAIQQQSALTEYYADLRTKVPKITRDYMGGAEEMIIYHKNVLTQLSKKL